MVRLQGIHIAAIDQVRTAAEGAVAYDKGITTSDALVMDAYALIDHEWHSGLPAVSYSAQSAPRRAVALREHALVAVGLAAT
jgi:hypothetical protein